MSSDHLLHIGEATVKSVCQTLEMLAPGRVGDPRVLSAPPAEPPVTGFEGPGVATSVTYFDGATGGNVFVMSMRGAHKLAAAMMGMPEEGLDTSGELDEMGASAVSEAMNQMMAAAAAALSLLLGSEVEISTPTSHTFEQAHELDRAFRTTSRQIRAELTVCGEPCRLVLLVPNAFVIRISEALDGIVDEDEDAAAVAALAPSAISLSGITVRFSATLGRAPMASAQLLTLPAGSVVELDRRVEEPIELLVNGQPFADGHLVVREDGEWAVQIAAVHGLAASSSSVR